MQLIYRSTQYDPGYPGYPERSGEVVEIVEELTRGDALNGADVDAEVGRMFRIAFADGQTIDAFMDELYVRTAVAS